MCNHQQFKELLRSETASRLLMFDRERELLQVYCKGHLVLSNNFPTTTHAPHSHTTTLSNISYRVKDTFGNRDFVGKPSMVLTRAQRPASRMYSKLATVVLPPHSGCEPMSLPRAGAVSTQHRAPGCHLSGLACKCNATARMKARKIFPWRRVVLVRNLALASVVWVWANTSYNSFYCVVSRLEPVFFSSQFCTFLCLGGTDQGLRQTTQLISHDVVSSSLSSVVRAMVI